MSPWFLQGGEPAEKGQDGERLGWPTLFPGFTQMFPSPFHPSLHLQAQTTEAELTAPAEEPPQHGPLRGASRTCPGC